MNLKVFCTYHDVYIAYWRFIHIKLCIIYSILFSCQFQWFHSQAKDFIKCVSGSSSLYGLQSDTLESLVLTLLPPLGHNYRTLGEPSVVDSTVDVRVYLVQELLQSLRHCAGFHIPPVSQNYIVILSWVGRAVYTIKAHNIWTCWHYLHVDWNFFVK